MDINSQPTGFNIGLLLLPFYGWWLPYRSLVLGFRENPLVLFDENIIEDLFWINHRRFIFRLFLGTTQNKRVQNSVGCYRFRVSELFDGGEACQSCGVSILS